MARWSAWPRTARTFDDFDYYSYSYDSDDNYFDGTCASVSDIVEFAYQCTMGDDSCLACADLIRTYAEAADQGVSSEFASVQTTAASTPTASTEGEALDGASAASAPGAVLSAAVGLAALA
ncbi:hypothetical protein JL720_10017 [Aureococcus anophagefferens]|nr:hypothetical protein JL720_10017 [Aureococcus anophagefferens]